MKKDKNRDMRALALQQRWLAVGLLIAVVMVIILIIIVPLVSKGMELHETKNNLVFRLQQYERILEKKEAVIASSNGLCAF